MFIFIYSFVIYTYWLFTVVFFKIVFYKNLILISRKLTLNLNSIWRFPCGVMVKAMTCGIVVSEFVLQSRYYVHFRANTVGKGMNPIILPSMG